MRIGLVGDNTEQYVKKRVTLDLSIFIIMDLIVFLNIE